MTHGLSRRKFLARSAAGAVSATALGAPAAESSTERSARAIITGGHPGDPEYGCGGTAARLAGAGCEVVLLYLNEGEPREASPRLPSGTRRREAQKACEILNARAVFAGQADGDAVVDRAHYETLRRLIEAEKPDVVFTHWPIDNHADHRAMSMLVYDAWFTLKRSFALYYYEVSDGEDTEQFAPTHYVGIDAVEEKKRAACFAHASQNPEKFYTLQDTVAKWRGLESGCTRAEAFIRHVRSKAFALPPTP